MGSAIGVPGPPTTLTRCERTAFGPNATDRTETSTAVSPDSRLPSESRTRSVGMAAAASMDGSDLRSTDGTMSVTLQYVVLTVPRCSSHVVATDVPHCSALGWHVRMAPPAIESWQGPLGLARSSCIEMRCPAAFTCRNNSVGNRSGSSAICPGCPGFAPPYRPTHTHRDLGKFRMDQVEGTESLFGLSAAIHMLGKEAPDGFLEVHRDVADRSHSIVTVISDEAVLPRDGARDRG